MKKKEQLQALIIINYFIAIMMFASSLITKAHGLIPFGFAVLIGTTIVRYLGKSKTNLTIPKLNPNEELRYATNKKPALTFNEEIEAYWNRFKNWLNS